MILLPVSPYASAKTETNEAAADTAAPVPVRVTGAVAAVYPVVATPVAARVAAVASEAAALLVTPLAMVLVVDGTYTDAAALADDRTRVAVLIELCPDVADEQKEDRYAEAWLESDSSWYEQGSIFKNVRYKPSQSTCQGSL